MDRKTFILAALLILIIVPAAMAAYATYSQSAFRIGNGKDIDLNGQSIGNGTFTGINIGANISSATQNESCDYTIWNDAVQTNAKSGITGIPISGTATQVFQTVLNTGKNICVQAGHYNVDRLDLTGVSSITGAGVSTILKANNDGVLLNITAKNSMYSSTKISNLMLDGMGKKAELINFSGGAFGVEVEKIYFYNTSASSVVFANDTLVNNIYFNYVTFASYSGSYPHVYAPIVGLGADYIRISNSVFAGNATRGIFGRFSHVRVYNNHFESGSNIQDYISLQGIEPTITNNFFVYGNNGITLWGDSSYAIITQNIFIGNKVDINITQIPSDAVGNPINAIIRQNVLDGAVIMPIYVGNATLTIDAGRYTTITDNTFINTNTPALADIYTTNLVFKNNVLNNVGATNVIKGVSSTGIYTDNIGRANSISSTFLANTITPDVVANNVGFAPFYFGNSASPPNAYSIGEGDWYYDTTLHQVGVKNATAWHYLN